MSFTFDNSKEEDTPPHASSEVISMLSKLSIDERATRFFSLWNFAREMQWTGIKMRNPSLIDSEVTKEFKKIMYNFYSQEKNSV